MGGVRRGVAQFPYVWVGALSDGGQREIIIVSLRRGPVLTARATHTPTRKKKMKKKRGRKESKKEEANFSSVMQNINNQRTTRAASST